MRCAKAGHNKLSEPVSLTQTDVLAYKELAMAVTKLDSKIRPRRINAHKTVESNFMIISIRIKSDKLYANKTEYVRPIKRAAAGAYKS